LGLSLGSFVNALVWRLHEQSLPASKRFHKAQAKELSIVNGRSICVHCGHKLGALDLIPVVSWLALRGRCRYCRKIISWQYPAVEMGTAVAFILTYVFWPREFDSLEAISFGLWLVCLTGFAALIVYDLRWMLLPNRIIFPLYGVAVALVISHIVKEMSWMPLVQALGGILIGGGLFYVLFQVSNGRWIGGGDVKLGFLLGAILGDPTAAVLMLFLASMLGTIIIFPLLLTGKATRTTRIPFGPFLILGAIVAELFGKGLIDWYVSSFISV
jgi:prepilin signal peptidase PulO-like enzyme (type II secretory pathway)